MGVVKSADGEAIQWVDDMAGFKAPHNDKRVGKRKSPPFSISGEAWERIFEVKDDKRP